MIKTKEIHNEHILQIFGIKLSTDLRLVFQTKRRLVVLLKNLVTEDVLCFQMFSTTHLKYCNDYV